MSIYMQHFTKIKNGKVCFIKKVTITSEVGSLKFVTEADSELEAYKELLSELQRFSGSFYIDFNQSVHNVKQKIKELENKE